MTSLWLDRALPEFAPPENGRTFDVLVIGAGLTGLTTALLLARAGRSVGVVEARHLGAGTTGNTTAKVSLLQGTRLSSIRRRHSDEILRHYVQANAEGQAWLRRYCTDHSIDVQSRSAYTYAATDAGVPALHRELAAARAAGLGATLITETELPYRVKAAVQLADQAQVDPIDVLTEMSLDLINRGGVIYQGARVRSVNPGRPATVRSGPGHAARGAGRAGHRHSDHGPRGVLGAPPAAAFVRAGLPAARTRAAGHVPVRGLTDAFHPVRTPGRRRAAVGRRERPRRRSRRPSGATGPGSSRLDGPALSRRRAHALVVRSGLSSRPRDSLRRPADRRTPNRCCWLPDSTSGE